VPCAIRQERELRNSGPWPSDSARPFSAPACIARRLPREMGSVPMPTQSRRDDTIKPSTAVIKQAFSVENRKQARRLAIGSNRDALAPLRGAEQRSPARKKGEHCLRAQPELRSPRGGRVAQGTGQRPAPTQGSPFLWLLSFGEAKESTPARQAESALSDKSTNPLIPRPPSTRPPAIPAHWSAHPARWQRRPGRRPVRRCCRAGGRCRESGRRRAGSDRQWHRRS
jgi:hypothetical protein